MTAAQKRSFGSRSIQILSFCAMICAWLIAGTFFAFSDFVMFALEQLEPEVGIAAMQAMNVTVEEHFFVLAANCMFPLSIVLIAVWAFMGGPRPLAIGGLVFIIGAGLPTLLGNIPLNVSLAGMSARETATHSFWLTFIPSWLLYNHVRLAACIVAALCFSFATFTHSQRGLAR